MAETEVIVTKFEADLTDLDAGVAQYEKQLNSASAASDKLDKKTTDLGGTVGALGPKFDAVKQSAERTHKEIDLTGQSIDQLKAKLATLTKARGGLIDPKAIAKSNADIAAVRNQITKLETSVIKAKGGASGLFGSITQGASQAAPGLSNVTSLFGGLGGPIGIAAAAVAGFIANFSRLDSVKVFFDQVSIGFDQIGDRLANLDFRGLFDPATQQKDAKFAAAQAKALDLIQDRQLKVNKANAEAELQIAGLNQQLRDRTKSDVDRLAIASQIANIEANRAKEETGLLAFEVSIQKAINQKQIETLGEVSDANKAALNEREIALLASQQRTVQLTESTERRVNSILEQGVSERAAIASKNAAAQAKIDAEAAKNAEARAQATAKLESISAGLAGELLATQQTDAEKEVQAVKDKYAAIEKATAEGIAKLREASGANEQSGITGREAELAVQIDTAKNAELAALDKARLDAQAKTQEEAIDQLRQSLLTETEIQREAALQRLDADLLLAEQTLATQEEFDAFRLERTRQTEAELSTILTDAQTAQLEAEKASLEERVRLQEEAQVAIGTAVGESVALLVGAAAQGEAVQEQAGKAIVGIFLDTLEKIILGQALAITAGSTADGAQKGGAPGALIGLAAGAAIAGVIKGLFALFKSQIAGNYQGDPYISGTPTWSGRDGHLRRLDEGERVVTKRDNLNHWDELEAMRKGTYDDLIYRKHIAPAIEAIGYNDMGNVNAYLSSDTGQRIAQSVMLAKFYDANIVGELKRGGKQGKVQTELLAQIARNGRRNASRW